MAVGEPVCAALAALAAGGGLLAGHHRKSHRPARLQAAGRGSRPQRHDHSSDPHRCRRAAWCSRIRSSLAARNKPRAIIDYATLTGACVYALTERYSGAFTNRPETARPHRSGRRQQRRARLVLSHGQRFRHGSGERGRRCPAVRPGLERRSHPGGALPQPVRSRRAFPGCTWTSPPVRGTAGSGTSRPKSPDSACAIRSICCAADGRPGPQANERL